MQHAHHSLHGRYSNCRISAVSGYGLHFAFIYLYNLEVLDFRIISTLSTLKKIDLLIHLSAMDLQRNLSVRSNLR